MTQTENQTSKNRSLALNQWFQKCSTCICRDYTEINQWSIGRNYGTSIHSHFSKKKERKRKAELYFLVHKFILVSSQGACVSQSCITYEVS